MVGVGWMEGSGVGMKGSGLRGFAEMFGARLVECMIRLFSSFSLFFTSFLVTTRWGKYG